MANVLVIIAGGTAVDAKNPTWKISAMRSERMTKWPREDTSTFHANAIIPKAEIRETGLVEAPASCVRLLYACRLVIDGSKLFGQFAIPYKRYAALS